MITDEDIDDLQDSYTFEIMEFKAFSMFVKAISRNNSRLILAIKNTKMYVIRSSCDHDAIFTRRDIYARDIYVIFTIVILTQYLHALTCIIDAVIMHTNIKMKKINLR